MGNREKDKRLLERAVRRANSNTTLSGKIAALRAVEAQLTTEAGRNTLFNLILSVVPGL